MNITPANISNNHNINNGTSSVSNNNDITINNDNGNQFVSNMMNNTGNFKSPFDNDVIRLIGQHLTELGMKQTVDLLLRESGLSSLNHPLVSKFQQNILTGQWESACNLASDIVANIITNNQDVILKEMQLMISEQKFLELLEDNQYLKALKCLRLELTPSHTSRHNFEKIQQLASILICKSNQEIRNKAKWSGKGIESRKALLTKLQTYIPTPMMLPENRLKTLLNQAIQLQREKCLLHPEFKSDDINHIDLKEDHSCKADRFPIDSCQVIEGHHDEIWYCQFSHDGTKLATGGEGGNVKIWDVDPKNHVLSKRCQLGNHGYSINCLSWSPNDEYLLVCLSDSKPGLNIWHINRECLEKSITLTDDHWTATCSWHPSGTKFAAASIKGNFIIYDMDGNISGQREGLRVIWLAFPNQDDKIILAADNLYRIVSYKVNDMLTMRGLFEGDLIIQERRPIMCFTLDSEDKYMAVNLASQGLHLWDFKNRSLLKIFSHSKQCNFVIHSSFSSTGTFLATGSEDGRVYIYNVGKDEPIVILHGHSRCANSVSWNPKHPDMLVSVGDDRLIRLWGPATTSSTLSNNITVPGSSRLPSGAIAASINNTATLGSNANLIYNELIIGQQ